MSESKRRKAEIEALKTKGQKEKKPRRRSLEFVRDYKVPHFKNAAARATCTADLSDIRNGADMSKAVNDGLIEPKLVRPVEIKVRTLKTDAVPLAKQPRAVPSYIFGHKPTPEELAERAAEKSEPKVFELSKRGKKRAAAGQEMKARIVLDRLIAQFPDRVIKARSVERYVNWFVGRTMEILEGAVDSEWLTSLAKERIKEGVEIKHLHATARREFEAQYLEAA